MKLGKTKAQHCRCHVCMYVCMCCHSHGLAGHRNTGNSDQFKNPLVVAYYNVDYTKNPKGTNYWRNRLLHWHCISPFGALLLEWQKEHAVFLHSFVMPITVGSADVIDRLYNMVVVALGNEVVLANCCIFICMRYFYRAMLAQSAVMRLHVVCLSVCNV